MIYFDHNATSTLAPEARDAWLDAVERFPANPSSPHRLGARAEAALNTAREELAGILNCHPLDIVWTSGATESCNAVLNHLARNALTRPVWISAVEHPAVIAPARQRIEPGIEWIPCTPGGCVDLNWIQSRLEKARPPLVAVMAANNETGAIQPWQSIAAACREASVPFFCDAVQWLGKAPASALGQCDFLAGSAHKFGGPRGIGFLKCARGPFNPLLLGGPQEDERRAGTENVAGALAMVRALAGRERLLQSAADRIRLAWRTRFEQDLLQACPEIEILCPETPRLWNTVSVLMPRLDCRKRWVVLLDKAGAAVSTGSACSSGKEAPSHVLAAMGIAPERAGRVLRFSSGWETTEADWRALLDALLSTLNTQYVR